MLTSKSTPDSPGGGIPRLLILRGKYQVTTNQFNTSFSEVLSLNMTNLLVLLALKVRLSAPPPSFAQTPSSPPAPYLAPSPFNLHATLNNKPQSMKIIETIAAKTVPYRDNILW